MLMGFIEVLGNNNTAQEEVVLPLKRMSSFYRLLCLLTKISYLRSLCESGIVVPGISTGARLLRVLKQSHSWHLLTGSAF